MLVSFKKYATETTILGCIKFLSIISILLIFASNARAISLYSPKPINGSYITGGAIYNFSIFVSGYSINATIVKLHFGSQEVWPDNRSIYNMSCREVNETIFLCYREIEIVAAESGTKEYYFFEAFEDGNYTSLGNITSPLFVTIDRLPPKITALNFVNNSYISTSRIIEVSIEDTYSGVDNSSVLAFVEMNGNIKVQNATQVNNTKNWNIRINTIEFENNESINIYVNASDILGNKNTSFLGVARIDNELPTINIITPKEGEEIRGIYPINISLLERYSGIDKVFIKIGNLNFNTNCQKINETHYSCLYNLNTSLISDGDYSLEVTASDNANNSAISSITISINNKKPSLYIEVPPYGKGIVQINSSVLGRREIVTDVFIRIANIEEKMSCNQDFSFCTYLLNTTKLKDGSYNILVYAKNTLNYSVNASKDIIIDNTPPSIMLTQDFSQIYVKGNFNFVIIVTDENPMNENDIKLRYGNKEVILNCISTLQGRKMQCSGILESTILPDGKNKITFSAKDVASNFASKDVEIIVDNNGPELINLIVNPIYSENPTNISFEAVLRDKVSGVSWVRLIVRARNETYTIGLQNKTNWITSAYFSSLGKHYVDLQASDINNNTRYYSNVGYFFIGRVECGNGMCEEHENYCVCKEDCNKPTCDLDEDVVCDSGIPRCVKLNVCGNGICESNEDCKTCEEDCDACRDLTITTTIKREKDFNNRTAIEKTEEGNENAIEKISIIIEQITTVLEENSHIIFAIILIAAIIVIFIIKIKSKKKHIIIVKLEKGLEET